MTAVVMHTHGGPEILALERVPVPVPQAEEALIRVHAVGIEPGLDVNSRQSGGGHGIALPHVLGASFAGVVVEQGGESTAVLGSRVAVSSVLSCSECRYCRCGNDNLCARRKVLGVHRWGGYAEFATVPSRNLIPIADTTSYEVAASAPVSYGTAWRMMVTKAHVGPADLVLIMGASGAVGVAAAQIARFHGAHVILGSRRPDALSELAEDVDAVGVIDTSGDIVAQVSELAGGGVDLVVETVGAATWSSGLAVLNTDGRLVCCGAPSGGNVSLVLRDLYRRGISLDFVANCNFQELGIVMQLIDDGRLRPRVHATYPLSHVQDAHRALARQQHLGKLVLIPDDKFEPMT